MKANIFQQAYEIITAKTTDRMTNDEIEIVSRATAFVANELPKFEPIYDDLPISEGLLRLVKILQF